VNLNDHQIYAGIYPVTLGVDSFALGNGIVLSATYAHLMQHLIMAFTPVSPGQSHSAPWKQAKGGSTFDIRVQLYVPTNLQPPNHFDRLNVVWLVAALLRLKITPLVQVPVISNMAFSSIASSSEDPIIVAIENTTERLIPIENPSHVLNEPELLWVRNHWFNCGELYMLSTDFSMALLAFDSVTMLKKNSIALLVLWGAIEQLFSPAKQELRFRISAALAAYLEPAGEKRLDLYKNISKLYNKRSEVAHSTGNADFEIVTETYRILARVLIKIIEQKHIPTRGELEIAIFS